MAEHFVIPEAMPEVLPAIAVQVVGNTIPPPLPHNAPEVWPEIWITRPDPISLLVDSASRENHWDISSDMRDLLHETLAIARSKEAASIVEAAIGPMDLGKVLASLPRFNCRNEQPFITANMRGRVDGIIRLMPSTSMNNNGPRYVLVFEDSTSRRRVDAMASSNLTNRAGQDISLDRRITTSFLPASGLALRTISIGHLIICTIEMI